MTLTANGNIGQLIDNDGAVVAAYTYDPFGNVTEMAGAEAAENPWRFSTKPVEAGTGWLYYGYRWYDAGMGRWVSRDPIGEMVFFQLYSKDMKSQERDSVEQEALRNPFVGILNNPIDNIDGDGAIVQVAISAFGLGSSGANTILSCVACFHLAKCMKRAEETAQRAAEILSPDNYYDFLLKTKPGEECLDLAMDCGEHAIKAVFFFGGRILVLRYLAKGGGNSSPPIIPNSW